MLGGERPSLQQGYHFLPPVALSTTQPVKGAYQTTKADSSLKQTHASNHAPRLGVEFLDVTGIVRTWDRGVISIAMNTGNWLCQCQNITPTPFA